MNEIYNRDYYLRHLKYNGSDTELALNEFRLSLAEKAVYKYSGSMTSQRPLMIVDYGCSHGAFLQTFQSKNKDPYIDLIGVDINPYCVAHCVHTGLTAFTPDMYDYFYKDTRPYLITFWDVLEHLTDPRSFLKEHKPEFICVSLPCLDGFYEKYEGKDLQLWKHFRPLEHIWNFTVESFSDFMYGCKYEVKYKTFDESKIRFDPVLGEKNIMSFILRRFE